MPRESHRQAARRVLTIRDFSLHFGIQERAVETWIRIGRLNAGNGLLTKVTTIQRVHTQGGKPPAEGCDESHQDAQTKSSYTADYYFYAPES